MALPLPSDRLQLWKKRLVDFDQSNLTVAQFCQSIGCSTPTFYQWKRKIVQGPSKSAFLQVKPTDSLDASLEVKLPGGVSILVPLHAVESLKSILDQVG